MNYVRTVTGDIPPEHLGLTLLHEHLIGQSQKSGGDLDLVLDNESAAAFDLFAYRLAGGRALVEMSPRDYGRDPLTLRHLSQASGIHIISVTGYIKGASADPFVADRTVADLADEMIRDITLGIGETDVRAGVLKGGSSLNTITPNEEKIFRAAACAQRATGALISTHTEAGTMALEQVALLTAEGVPPDRILIGHLDRKLDWDYHLAVAQTGVTLGYDQFSKEKYYADSERIRFVVRMVEAGYGGQIALSGDLARRSDRPGYGGGPGYTFMLWRILPWLRKEGLTESDIIQIMVSTPARLLALPA